MIFGASLLGLTACSEPVKHSGQVPERAGVTVEQVHLCLNDDRKALLNLHGISPELQHAYNLCIDFVQSHPQEASIALKFRTKYVEEEWFNDGLQLPEGNPIWPKFEAIAEAIWDAPDYNLLLEGVEDVEALAQLAAIEGKRDEKWHLLIGMLILLLFGSVMAQRNP